jgi:hypothetical protein
MSPRAACRLEALGFTELYDYVTGKADWLARALPTEGDEPRPPRVADLPRDDVATAEPHERIADVLPRVHGSPYRFALVTSRGRVLLGRLRRAALEGDPAATAEQVMEAGPSTIRPDTEATALARRLRTRELTTAVVTDPDGVLLGVSGSATASRTERAVPNHEIRDFRRGVEPWTFCAVSRRPSHRIPIRKWFGEPPGIGPNRGVVGSGPPGAEKRQSAGEKRRTTPIQVLFAMQKVAGSTPTGHGRPLRRQNGGFWGRYWGQRFTTDAMRREP